MTSIHTFASGSSGNAALVSRGDTHILLDAGISARRIAAAGQALIIRVPVVPGFNDNEEEIGKIAAFFRAHGRPAKIELLPYHRLGENKNAALGREGFTADPPAKELMARLNALFDDLR